MVAEKDTCKCPDKKCEKLNRIENRFTRELFRKYPFIASNVEKHVCEGNKRDSCITTHRASYRNPAEVVKNLDVIALSRAGMINVPTKVQPKMRTKPDRKQNMEHIKEERKFREKTEELKRMKFEPRPKKVVNAPYKRWTTEYTANINTVGDFIIKNKIFTKERIRVPAIRGLPD